MNPSVYREAAERITDGRCKGCCRAIFEAGKKFRSAEEAFFAAHFSQPRTFWWPEFGPKNQLARSLALLLMAEIAEEME